MCVLIIILHGFVGRTFFQHIGAWKQHGLRSGRGQVEMQPPSKSCQMWNSSSNDIPTASNGYWVFCITYSSCEQWVGSALGGTRSGTLQAAWKIGWRCKWHRIIRGAQDALTGSRARRSRCIEDATCLRIWSGNPQKNGFHMFPNPKRMATGNRAHLWPTHISRLLWQMLARWRTVWDPHVGSGR